jgi:hypothetical protein
MVVTFHARSVQECWNIARRIADAYQRAADRQSRPGQWQARQRCLAARNAASRVALKIRYGRYRPR